MFSHKKSLCFLTIKNKILTILYTGNILITGEENPQLPTILHTSYSYRSSYSALIKGVRCSRKATETNPRRTPFCAPVTVRCLFPIPMVSSACYVHTVYVICMHPLLHMAAVYHWCLAHMHMHNNIICPELPVLGALRFI